MDVVTSLPVYLLAAGTSCKDIEVLVGVKRDLMLHRFFVDLREQMITHETSRKGLKMLSKTIGIYHLSELFERIGRLYKQYAVLFSQATIFCENDTVLVPCGHDDLHAFVRVCCVESAHAHEFTQLPEHAVADERLSHCLGKLGEQVHHQEQTVGIMFQEDDAVVNRFYRIDQLSL